MTRVLIKDTQRRIDRLEKRKLCEVGGRDVNNAATSQGIPAATGRWRRKGGTSLRASSGSVALLTNAFHTSAPRTAREYSTASQLASDYLFQKPQEISHLP